MTNNTPRRLTDKVAIVTGSTRGIGEGIATRLATEGARVIVTGRTVDDGESIVEDIHANGGEASFVQADMRSPTDIEALITATVEEYGGLDILVNNAGVQTETSVTEATLEDWNFVLETDFRSYWLCAKHAAEHMDEGVIINVSSNHAFLTMPAHFPYNAVKAGINGMTRAMAVDLGPDIRVNTVNPGWVAVDRTVEELDETDRNRVKEIHPLKRIGDPADVAGPVAFLVSDDAAFVTGASLLVDGGRTAVMDDQALLDYTE